MATIYF